MIIGILSDSHGKVEAVRAAVRVLRQNGAATLFHCGDIGDVDVLSELLDVPTHFVWGNIDRPDGATRGFCEAVGLPWPDPPVTVGLAGKWIAMYHGHEVLSGMRVEDGKFDYVFYGHTHDARDSRQGKTRFINPGALYRAPVKTVATLDLVADVLTFYEVPTGRIVRV